MMVVFALGSDSGFQIGADGILDDYDDEGGISVVLWCIIFVFLLVVTIWFYMTQLSPSRTAKCVDDEDEDEEQRVANKLLNHLASGKAQSKSSPCYELDDVCKPSTSRENEDNYEVIDGEIRILHSGYEWQNAESCSKGNQTAAKEMSDTLVRRPSMEEMSLIFPGVLASITEEDEDEDDENREKTNKGKELFDRDVCRIRDLEPDTVESCSNISPDSNVYEASSKVHSPTNTGDVRPLDEREDCRTFIGKDISGRQITNRKGKLPAQNSRVTAEIRLRASHKEIIERTEQNIPGVHAVISNNDKSCQDKKSQVFLVGPAGSGDAAENAFNENKVRTSELGKTSSTSQNTKTFITISGSKAHEFDPVDQALVSNMSADFNKPQKEATPADREDFKADERSSEYCEDTKTMLPISASMNSNCYVNKKADEDIVCIETSQVNFQSEPDRVLEAQEENNNRTKNETFAGSSSKEKDGLLSNDLSNSTFRDSNNTSDQLTHAWTFYSMSESAYDQINGDHQDAKSAVEKGDQSQEIPQIVVDSYEEVKKISNVNNFINDTWPQLDEQIDSFETDIDVDDVDLEQENELNDTEGSDFNMFLKRHVSVTDLDKILSSTESAQDENRSASDEDLENELAKENNPETIVRGINISSANNRVYTESSLDDIWDDYECPKNGTSTHNVKHSTEIPEEMSENHSSGNRNDVTMKTNEFFSRQTVWTTLDQVTDNSKIEGENKNNKIISGHLNENSNEKEKKRKTVEVTVLSKKLNPTGKERKNMGRKSANAVSEITKTETSSKHFVRESEVLSLEKKMPEVKKGSEEESILRTPISHNEFNASNSAEGNKLVNNLAQRFKEGEKSKSTKLENLHRDVDGEAIVESLSSKNSVHNNRRIIITEPESASEVSGADVDSGVFVKHTIAEATLQDSSPKSVDESPELSKIGFVEKFATSGSNNDGSISDTNIEMLQSGIVLDGRTKQNAERTKRERLGGMTATELDAGNIDIHRPVSTNRRDDVIYGKRKTKKDNNGKRADFIINLNAKSRKHEKVTSSPYASESDDSDALLKVTQAGKKDVTSEHEDATAVPLAGQTCKDEVNSGEHLSRTTKEANVTRIVTHSNQDVEVKEKSLQQSTTVTHLEKDVNDKNMVDERKVCTLKVTQSSEPIEPDVNIPLESAQILPSADMETETNAAGATGKQDAMVDKKTQPNEVADNHSNYRVERRNVQPKIEKSIVLNTEKKQLQTFITIDQVPDTHIGLKICMTGRFDVAEQNKPITGLEKAEQIVANRSRRIEAEKIAAEEKEKEKDKAVAEGTDQGVHKETKPRKDYSMRKAKYDETRYRRSNRGVVVNETVTSEESSSRQINWNDFKLDDTVLDEVDITNECTRIDDISEEIDVGYHVEIPKPKTFKNTNQIIKENVVSETFSPREVDWSLLDLDDDKNENNKKAGIVKEVAGVTDEKNKGKTCGTVYDRSNVDSNVNKYQSKYTKIFLEKDKKDERKDDTKGVATKEPSPKSQEHSSIKTESITTQKKKEIEKQKPYNNNRNQIGFDRKKRSEDLKKEICDELSNMNIEIEEPKHKTSAMSSPCTEPEFPVRLTKSFSELRSIGDGSHVGISKLNERSSVPSSPQDHEAPQGLEDQVFDEYSERVFKTKVTVDEVRGNKRRIVILNIRKKSPGNAKWKSLNDIDTLSTVQKQVFKFRSISSSLTDEDQVTEAKPESSQNGNIKDTIFAASALCPTQELDSVHKSEEIKPVSTTSSIRVNKEAPLEKDIEEHKTKAPVSQSTSYVQQRRTKKTSQNSSKEPNQKPKESPCSHTRSPEENAITASRHSPTSSLSYKDRNTEDKNLRGRSITPEETVFVASAYSPTHSSDTGYNSKDEKAVQRKSSLSPVTVHTSRTSTTGTMFAWSRHSPTPLSDSENKDQEHQSVQRQSSLSPVTVHTSRTSPTGTMFALSRHSPTPISEPENKPQRETSVQKQASLSPVKKEPITDRDSHHEAKPRKGTFFAVSRYSPATSDSETNQGPFSRSPTELQSKHRTARSPKDTVVPVSSLSKKPVAENESKGKDAKQRYSHASAFEVKSSNKGANPPKDEQPGKVKQVTRKSEVHETINEKRREEVNSAPGRRNKETAFGTSGHTKPTDQEPCPKQNEAPSSRTTLTKLRSPDDTQEKNETKSTNLSYDSDGEYRITQDGWLEKIADSPSLSDADDQQNNKIVKVTDLDSLLGGITSPSGSVKKEETETVQKTQAASVVNSTSKEYNRKVVSKTVESRRVVVTTTDRLDKSLHTRITSSGVQETDLDALFCDEDQGGLPLLQEKKKEETVESRTSSLRKAVVDRSGNILVSSSKENHLTTEKPEPIKARPIAVNVADNNQEVPIIKAIPINESPAFGDLDDDVFTQTTEKLGVHQNGYHRDGTYSSDADSETSSLNSVPLKPKNRHTRSSLEAVKSAVRPPRSPLSSDSSSATPVPSERSDAEFDPFQLLPGSTSSPDRNKREHPKKSFVGSRKAAKESGPHSRQVTAEGNGFLIDSSDGAAQRITRAYSESQVGTTEYRRSAFTPVRNREKERRFKSQEHILSGIPDEKETMYYNDSDPDRNTESIAPTFKEMVESHKSMPDLHKPQSESDALQQRVPYHSRLSAHTRLWLSQTAGIDTSNLCKDDSIGSEIFLYPSNRFQPGKSVDASFLSFLSDTDDVPDDVSTRPSSPMSEFSFAGETPFGGDFLGDVTVVTCGNDKYCRKDEVIRGHDKTSFTSCPSCFTYYCSHECRRAHWREHKKVCYFGRINSYMRSFVYFCHKKENLKLLLSKIATRNFGSKGRGSVMVTFASPKQSRKFMTSGCVLLPSPPSYSTIRELQQEGVVSKHKVNLIQQVKDYDPNQEFVLNLAIVAGRVDDLPLYPVPRHKLSTVLQCIKIPLSDSLIQQPKAVVPDTTKETRVFYLPKCSRHEFVNDMEARRHYCRNISKGLKEYGIRMKKDYPEAYDNLCLYVEKNIPFKPLTVYGNKESKIIACKIMPEGYSSTTLL